MTLLNRPVKDDCQHPHHSRRKTINVSSCFLLAAGIISGVFAYDLIESAGANSLFLVPSIVAITTALLNLTTYKPPR